MKIQSSLQILLRTSKRIQKRTNRLSIQKDSQQAKEAPKLAVNPKVPIQPSNANAVSNGTSSKPVAKPKPEQEKEHPTKTEGKAKTNSQKDPQEDNGWGAVQSGGWGASACAVRVNSNVSAAKVYIDGQRRVL